MAKQPGIRLGKLKLGDAVESALKMVGITEERVSNWLGRPCGCTERKEKLNSLGMWAQRVLSGKTDDAVKHLDTLIDDDQKDEAKKKENNQ